MINKIFSKIVDNDLDGLSIKKLVAKLGYSSRIIKALKKPGNMLVNSVEKNINHILKNGENIELFIEDDCSENIIPQEMQLDIIYEDDYILVINKSPGLVVHPTSYHFTDTLANGVMYYLQSKGEFCKFRPINRLDKDTSGLVLIAKSQLSHSKLSKQMIDGHFIKEYQAIMKNSFIDIKGTISAPIARKPGSIIERMVEKSGQAAITHYKIITQNETGAFVSVNLETGRTHQIRVHFTHIGHPLFGDGLYGESRELINRQALHCCNLSFIHPQHDEKVQFNSIIPQDMQKLLEKIGLEILL